MGAINFPMADVYGMGFSTTEISKPDAGDQQVLVDENKTDNLEKTPVIENTSSRKKIILAVIVVLIAIVLLGGNR